MTGILPIKKYGTHSALNMFDEFSMIDPGPLARYVGFTENEVKKLCEQYQMDMAEIKNWYDGCSLKMESLLRSALCKLHVDLKIEITGIRQKHLALRILYRDEFRSKDDVISMIAEMQYR